MRWFFKKMVKELPQAGLSNVHNNHTMYLQQCLSLAASQHEDGTRLHLLTAVSKQQEKQPTGEAQAAPLTWVLRGEGLNPSSCGSRVRGRHRKLASALPSLIARNPILNHISQD